MVGLPGPPLLLCGQRIKPTKYKMLIRMDVALFCCWASLLDWMIVTPKHHTPIVALFVMKME